ncbi:MAG: MFS transporter [Acetilactobacillus jinshanensis]
MSLINFSILSVSLLIAMGSAISPALPSIAKAFPQIPISIVDMIGTVQQFAVLLALFVSVAVAHKIGIKYTIMAGIFLVGISGLIPMFFNSFILIMLSRIVLGCGIGFFNSLAIDIINLYFKRDDKQRVKMCGIRTSFEPLGQCILNFACGFLVMISWHAAFAISLAAIPVFLLYWKFVPNISFGIYVLAAALMFLVMCNTAITIEVPNIVSNLHLGNSAFSSLIISLNTLAAMLMGFSFSKMYNIFHQFTLASGLVLIAAACLIMYMSKTRAW